jgi:glucose-1-phosphate thymidylyltransferase
VVRLRPHTLTIPKPLIPIAGKPIVHRLVEDIAKILDEPIDEIAFILGDPAFGDDLVKSLEELAKGLAKVYRQLEPLGTGMPLCVPKNRFQAQP